ncbi:MAG TPA: PIN domain-containing protein [Candidatus Dietzia merdigallinarum]|nr:PIN domain-containing protein [Candidatus Dietzia merdigallinarum]
MILVDTSVWIDHLHQVEPRLQQLLVDDDVVVHDGVLGELALGSLRQRHVILESLAALHRATVMSSDELLGFVDSARLWGRGLGVIDVHLLGSALLGRSAIWTRDKRLRAAAVELGIDVVASDE